VLEGPGRCLKVPKMPTRELESRGSPAVHPVLQVVDPTKLESCVAGRAASEDHGQDGEPGNETQQAPRGRQKHHDSGGSINRIFKEFTAVRLPTY
jgi:hypothetical protein